MLTPKTFAGDTVDIITTIEEMQSRSDVHRGSGKTIGLVPTMGYLHEGHLSLMAAARGKCDDLVVSIFVNPTQFGPGEDFECYPRDMDRDIALCEKAGVDAIFAPDVPGLYGENFQTQVKLTKLPGHLCGLSRPIHFDGVALVVTKLFNIVKPNLSVFGLKDFQQVAVIRQMVRDLNFDIEIIGAPIVREADGLAMSSRNAYLVAENRGAALSLQAAIRRATEAVGEGVRDAAKVIAMAREVIESHPATEIDYINICDPDTLVDVKEIDRPVLMAMAVKVGKPRLLDNAILAP